MTLVGLTFTLVPRRRLIGLAFGASHGARRGIGSDVAGSRPYQPGDDPDAIDWAATARLSTARGQDEFIVRQHFADEAPRAVVIADRRPEMGLCDPAQPWLRKDEASHVTIRLVHDSVVAARGLLGYLDLGEGGDDPWWRPPRPAQSGGLWPVSHRQRDAPFDAPPDVLTRSLEFLVTHRRAVPSGTFVFVLSDFLCERSSELWDAALDRGWDVVPVVIQDPVWEQSFPDIDGLVVPLAGAGGRRRLVRLRRGESAERRRLHEERYELLLSGFRAAGMEPVLVSRSEPEQVLQSFLSWTSERQFRQGHGW
jgi:uncharacterized protein (DUF58 family)